MIRHYGQGAQGAQSDPRMRGDDPWNREDGEDNYT